jgi:hypothetical protein
MNRAQTEQILKHPINHIGYSVDDLKKTINYWADTFRVGPFFLIEDIKFDLASYHGKPCVFEHSAAFAKWGDIFLELQQIQIASPNPLASLLRVNGGCVVNHVAYITSELEQESTRLEAMGMPAALHLRSGPVIEWVHDAPFLGHAIEIHTASEFLDEFWAQIGEAADRWDGINPIRVMAAPPLAG